MTSTAAGTAMPASPMTFGINIGRSASRETALQTAHWAEEQGFDVVTAADHLGSPAPFAILAAGAAVTTRVRLRTYVLDAGFWNPALLAREAATLDALSGGRLELGLGAGHMRHEHDDAGLPFPPLRQRVANLEAIVTQVRRRLADPGHRPAPVQRPIPVVIGGWGEASLTLAARHADIIALSGLVQVPGEPPGTFRLVSSAETADRVPLLRALLDQGSRTGGEPAPEPVVDVLLQRVEVSRPAEESARLIAQELQGRLSTEQLLDTPFLLLADSPEAGAAELLRRAAAYGVTSWMTQAGSGPGLAAVLRELRQ